MKVTKIVTAINENHLYISFVPLFVAAWRKISDAQVEIGFITGKDNSHPLVMELRKYATIYLISPIPGIDEGIQAKVSRMILASSFNSDTCLISDIDMIPLSPILLDVLQDIPDDHFVKYAYDHHAFAHGSPDYGKFPMDKVTAMGATLKEIINPRNLGHVSLIMSWIGQSDIDDMESVGNPFICFSDESLLRALYERWEHKNSRTSFISRKKIEGDVMLSGRLDRSNPQEINSHHVECHGLRPFNENSEFYKALMSYLKI